MKILSGFKLFGNLLLSRGQFDGLKIAIVFFVLCSFCVFNIFQSPVVNYNNYISLDDILDYKSGFFYEYILNLSSFLSSSILVSSFLIFTFLLIVVINNYINNSSLSHFYFILFLFLVFYVSLNFAVPFSEKIENKYLSSSNFYSALYSKDYDKAYGVVESSRVDDASKSYLNMQIAMDKAFDSNNISGGEVQFYIKNLDEQLSVNDVSAITFDTKILYKAYQISDDKENLVFLENVAEKEKLKIYFWILLLCVFLFMALKNLKSYRDLVDMNIN